MKFAKIDVSNAGANTVVTGVPTKKIRVLSYVIIAAGAVTAKWQSGTTDLSGAMPLAANGGAAPSISILAPGAMIGLFETAAGDSLVLNLGGAVNVSGHLTYIEVLT